MFSLRFYAVLIGLQLVASQNYLSGYSAAVALQYCHGSQDDFTNRLTNIESANECASLCNYDSDCVGFNYCDESACEQGYMYYHSCVLATGKDCSDRTGNNDWSFYDKIDSMYLVKGDNEGKCTEATGCDTVAASASEIHAVRCCSDYKISGWNKHPICSVWAESDVWIEGCQELNWNDANDFCISKGGRLCSREELETPCADETGCEFDWRLVWSSTTSGDDASQGTDVLIMKLKGGSDTFDYESSYWTDTNTLNPESTDADENDDIDAKLETFMTQSVRALKVCYNTLANCYTFTLDQTYTSAQALFSGNYIRSLNMGGGDLTAEESKEAFTDVFIPPNDQYHDDFWNGGHGNGCDMQRPGINTQCLDNNWARIGYCVNLPGQGCQPSDSNDADSSIGIGLKTQNYPNNINAPFGEYAISPAGNAAVDARMHQAWLFVAATTTTTTTTTTHATTTSLGPLCGVFSCGDDAMLKPLMNTEVGSNFETCCECSYAASNHAFLGMFMKGEFDNQSRKLSLSFDLPSDVQIQSVDWNGASNDTLSYASGFWTSSTVNQCRNMYVLNEGLAVIFGSGSLFSLSGTTLTTSIRVSATSNITEDGSTFERSYSEDIPILVGLETETTVQATFHMTMTEGELVHITGNAEHFATDGTVKLTMMVTTPGCIQNSSSIASGMQHLTSPEFTFGQANLVDNLCEQEVTLTFNPIEEFADQISIQFTSRQGVDFQIEVDVNIQAGSILDYLPFDAVMTFHAEPTFSDNPQAEFLLGAEVYAKIELSPLVNLPLSSITVNSFTLTQTGYSGELEITDLMNEGWSGFSYTATPQQDQIAAEFELESTHFHVTEEGELCEVDTDISIVYQDGTTVRRQLSMRRRLTTQQVSNGFSIAEAADSESMVAQILKQKTPGMKTFFIFAFFFTVSISIFRAYAATKQDEYASLLSADYDEF